MADFGTCASIQGLSPEDVAELREITRQNGGDYKAGVSAYLESLQQDLADLEAETAKILGVEVAQEYNQDGPESEVGTWSAVEVAATRMNLPAWKPSKKNPEGRALGRDIWDKISKEPNVKKEELEWIGLEELLTADYSAQGGMETPRWTREEVIELIKNNGVNVVPIIADQQAEDFDGGGITFTNEEVWDDPEAWQPEVENLLYSFDRGEEDHLGLSEGFMNQWVVDNIDDVVGNYIDSLPDDQQAELQEYAEENSALLVVDWIRNNVDADPSMDMRERARDEFEELAERTAEEYYLDAPYYIYELTDGDDESIGDGLFAFGNDDTGWSIREGDALFHSAEIPNGSEIYSLGEAEIQATEYAREAGLLGGEGEEGRGENTSFESYVEGDFENYREIKLTLPDVDGEFVESAHFQDENIVAFLRTTDRKLMEVSGKTFFIEELQSDWHQQGRQKGYEGPEVQARVDEINAELREPALELGSETAELILEAHTTSNGSVGGVKHAQRIFVGIAKNDPALIDSSDNYIKHIVDNYSDKITQEMRDEIIEVDENHKLRIKLSSELEDLISAVPNAPFKGDAWINLALKNALVMAAREGHTSFAWSNAAKLEDRWSSRYAELYNNLYNRKMVKMVKKLTGKKPEQFTNDGDPVTLETFRQGFIDRSSIEKKTDEETGEVGFLLHNPNSPRRSSMLYETEAEAEADLVESAEIYAEEMIENGEVGHWIIEIDDDLRNKILTQSFSLFQDGKKREVINPRGMIKVPAGGVASGKTTIELFETANLSTVLHEMGHFFLEAYAQMANSEHSTDGMKSDMATIEKYLGAKANTTNDSLPTFNTEPHELWARTVEAYVMEGKSPSLDLMPAFTRFKAWLKQVYKSILGLNVKITPEIREVMDRMFATDDEIEAMRTEIAAGPLFSDGVAAGMGEKEFRTYQKIAQESVSVAETRLLEKTMEAVSRETKSWYKKERAEVWKEVEKSVNKIPVYEMIHAITNGAWLDGRDEPVPDIRINKKMLEDQFSEGVISDIGRDKIGGRRAIYGDDGVSPQIAADMFGFSSANEMVEALQNAGKRKDYIKTDVDRIMVQRHGDPLNDGSIEEAAAQAVHTKQQESKNIIEARAIAKMLGKNTQAMTARIYKHRASLMFDRMKARNAMNPARFLAAERKAGKAAEKAWAAVARGGANSEMHLANAIEQKERQILNAQLYNQATDFQKMLNSKREKMQSYSKKSVRKKLDGDYIEQIDGLLEKFDFRVKSKTQVDKAIRLKDYVDKMVEDGRENQLNIDPRLLKDANKKHYTELSVDELNGLFSTIANIDYMGRNARTLMERDRKRNLDESAEIVSSAIHKKWGSGKIEKQSGTLRNYFNMNLTLDTISQSIDGEDFGDFGKQIAEGLHIGAAREQKMNTDFAEAISDVFSVYTKEERKSAQIEKNIEGANGYTWSKEQILAVALNSGTKSGLDRVLDQGVHERFRLTPDQHRALIDTLDQKDWQVVSSYLKLVNQLWPELKETHNRMSGGGIEKVEAIPIETKFGTIEGGYYPVAYNSLYNKSRKGTASDAVSEFLNTSQTGIAKVSDGMTKARVEKPVGNALLYDLVVGIKHYRDTTRLINLGEPVDNTRRILNHDTVVNAFNEAGQSNLRQMLLTHLEDIADGPIYNIDPLNKLSRHTKNVFTTSKLAFNIKTIALQMTGVGQSAAFVGTRNLASAYREYLKRPDETVEKIFELSPFMQERKTTFQKEIFEEFNDVRTVTPFRGEVNRKIENMKKWGFEGIVRTQFYGVDVPTWVAAFNKHYQETGDEKISAHRADRMVERSQGGGLMTDKTAMERGSLSSKTRQSDIIKIFTTLSGYMTDKMNKIYISTGRFRNSASEAETKAEIVRAATKYAQDIILLTVVEGAMIGLLYEAFDDDDETDDFLMFVAKSTAESFVVGIPLVSNVTSGFNGYDTGGVFSWAAQTISNPYEQYMQGEFDRAAVSATVEVGALTHGLPTTAIMRPITELFEDDFSTFEALFGRNPLKD